MNNQGFRREHRSRLLPGVVVASLLVLLSCQEKTPEPEGKKAVAPSLDETKAATTESHYAPRPVSTPGKWIESYRYRVRVLDVVPCDLPAAGSPSMATSEALPTASPGKANDSRFRLGVRLEVEATNKVAESEVVLTPKVFKLEKDGKVFRGVLKPELTPTCNDFFQHQRLDAGEASQGMVVFDAPNPGYLTGSVLKFMPRRWSGELEVQIQMPECLVDCGATGVVISPLTNAVASSVPIPSVGEPGGEADE